MIETYIPLYRKYRPQSFADVVGQDAIIQTLGNAITQNKVAHAYLLCGPRGTGKTSTARIFAKSLNCEQGPTTTPCQQCASCVGITRGNALDVVEFDAASNNSVTDARELIENCQFSPMAGKFKVYIIDEVHMLSASAFNALLKTLEEPPPSVVFIFATTEAHKVLPTIISRCQRFDFSRITNPHIVEQLRRIATAEEISIDDEALTLIARHVRGGMRDAVGLLDQVSVLGRAEPGRVIAASDVALFIGALEEDLLLAVTDQIATRQADALLGTLGELMNRGIEPIQLVKDLTMHLRNLLRVKAAGSDAKADALDVSEGYFAALQTQASGFELEELPQLLWKLSAIERNIRNTQQQQLWLEVGLLELAYRQDIHVLSALAEKVAALEAQLAALAHGGAVPAPAAAQSSPPRAAASPKPAPVAPAVRKAPAPGASPAPVNVSPPAESAAPNNVPYQPVIAPVSMPPPVAAGNDLAALHARICQKIASMPTRTLATQHTFIREKTETQLTLGCASEPNLAHLQKPDKLIHLQKAVEAVLGKGVSFSIVLDKTGAPAPAVTPAAPAPADPAQPPQDKIVQPSPQPYGPVDPNAPPVYEPELEPELEPQPEQVHRASPVREDNGPPDEDPGVSEATVSEQAVPVQNPLPAAAVSSQAPEGDLDAARQYTVSLLQGQLLP
ncbi:MAG: DNA polymerase III subunit gamma/tau [Candidatus Melainabacteria bacterium]